MPGKSGAKGHGPGGGWSGRDDPSDRPPPMDPGGSPDDEVGETLPDVQGRRDSSPGHLKKAAGAQSARDFAPGRANRTAAR
jgi:hypothetical protein